MLPMKVEPLEKVFVGEWIHRILRLQALRFRWRQSELQFRNELAGDFVLDGKQIVIFQVDQSLAEDLLGFGINQLIRDSQFVAISNETSRQDCIYFEICRYLMQIVLSRDISQMAAEGRTLRERR